tara:strand:- start:109 stop:1035 length:927 start_codon:yes stop_codon:yes gene_type:complete
LDKRSIVEWRGYIPAITTPFAADGAIDFGGLATLVDWLHGEGMHGLVVAGTTGEWTSMSDAERCSVFAAVGDQLSGKLPLLAGCSAFTAERVIAMATEAHKAGFSGILVTPPPYICPSSTEISNFYRSVAKGSPLPVCIYNWPPGTGIDCELDLLERLTDIDNIIAVKQSTSRLDRFVATFFALREKVLVFGHAMDEHGLALLEARGGDGTMGAGGVLGRHQPDFYNHLWAGEIEKARQCGRMDRVLMKEWYTPDLVGKFGSGPAILKAALDARGLPGGHVRAPLLDICEEDREKVRRTLDELGCLSV